MRISDWSSDVCSSDLLASRGFGIENTDGGTYSEHSPHADFSRCGVYGHLDEMRAEGRLLVAFVKIAILNGVLGPQISRFRHLGQCETEIACAYISESGRTSCWERVWR